MVSRRPAEAEAECDFLRNEIYRRRDASIESRLLTAYERYSDRGGSAPV
jgi:hypothetical protein